MNEQQAVQAQNWHPPGALLSTKGRTRNLTRTWVLDRDVRLGPELAAGGEGVVYQISLSPEAATAISRSWGNRELVAKIFHQPSDEKTAKLVAMLEHPPRDPTLHEKSLQHISIAWPIALLVRVQHNFQICIGFAMPYIDHQRAYPLLQLYNPRDRAEMQLGFTWRYLLRMVTNLASILHELHRTEYVVGDLNESNILVNKNALVTLVDCDSLQVPDPKTGGSFLCVVGKPEYTAPELQGLDFRVVKRGANQDNFALAVLIFLMLMEGRHPFSAAWEGEGMPPSIEENIRNGIFPYTPERKHLRPRYALPLTILPPALQDLMKRCFVTAHQGIAGSSRPTAKEWLEALDKAEGQLEACPINPSHIYSKHLNGRCPWCERVSLGISDPFPPPAAQVVAQATPQQLVINPPAPQPAPHPKPRQAVIPFSYTPQAMRAILRKRARSVPGTIAGRRVPESLRRIDRPVALLAILFIGEAFLLLFGAGKFARWLTDPLVFLVLPFVIYVLQSIFRKYKLYRRWFVVLWIIIFMFEILFIKPTGWFAQPPGPLIVYGSFLLIPSMVITIIFMLKDAFE